VAAYDGAFSRGSTMTPDEVVEFVLAEIDRVDNEAE